MQQHKRLNKIKKKIKVNKINLSMSFPNLHGVAVVPCGCPGNKENTQTCRHTDGPLAIREEMVIK